MGCRRLKALVSQLPPFGSSTWEQETLPLERFEQWMRSILAAQTQQKRIPVPGELTFGSGEAERSTTSNDGNTLRTTDPDVIAQFFGRHFSGAPPTE